jgi:voltage-gated potassium channel
MIATLVIPLVIYLPPQTHLTLEIIDWAIWAIFALELSIRTYLASRKLEYLKKNWIDVIVVILPILRIFRIFRAARLLRAFRLIRVMALFGKFTTEVKIILSRHHFHYILVVFIPN